VRFASAHEVLNGIREGDRDALLDERAATVTAVRGRRADTSGAALEAVVQLGVDPSPEGWRYRGRVVKAGAPFTLTTERYIVEGIVLRLDDAGGGKP
jgi:hypothetical protein